MKDDNLALWKLRHGKFFLNTFFKCGEKIQKGLNIKKTHQLLDFIRLGLLFETAKSLGKSNVPGHQRFEFTLDGRSIFKQFNGRLSNGEIYWDEYGNLEWRNFCST